MVSLWPWRGSDSSPASFEKALSALSSKIADNQSRLDKIRSSSRRIRVLWTLYLSFAYLVYVIVLLLVVGYHGMGAYEWTGVAGGPVLIYVTRTALSAYFNFRIENIAARLKEQQEERAKTIQKLKDATKYDSTMELIEKYGGEGTPTHAGRKSTAAGDVGDEAEEGGEHAGHAGGGRKKTGRRSQGAAPGRTSLPPPPTANIQNRPGTPQQPIPESTGPYNMEPGAEFAPNAEYARPPSPGPASDRLQRPPAYPTPAMAPESHWYDRVFDILLGEDETAPKNRIVLICSSCRLVNGQAPPGVKSLSEVGMWRCMSCGSANSEVAEDEGKRIVREVLGQSAPVAVSSVGDHEEKGDVDGEVEGNDEGAGSGQVELDDGPAASVRRRRSAAHA